MERGLSSGMPFDNQPFELPTIYGIDPSFVIHDAENCIQINSQQLEKKLTVHFPSRILHFELIANSLCVTLTDGSSRLLDLERLCLEKGIASWGLASTCPSLGKLPEEYPSVPSDKLMYLINLFGQRFYRRLAEGRSPEEVSALLNALDMDTIDSLLNCGVFVSVIEQMIFEYPTVLTQTVAELEKMLRPKCSLWAAAFMMDYRNPRFLADAVQNPREKLRFDKDEEAIRFAIMSDRALRIDSLQQVEVSNTKRLTIDPTRIENDGVRSYLVAYFRARKQWNAIPISCIHGIEILDEACTQSVEPNRKITRCSI